jgi:branched-chain amino acid transport system substrate-binding protein
MNGLYAAAPFFVPEFDAVDPDSWVGRWAGAYRQRFGEGPVAQSVIGYVMGDLTVMALESAGPEPTVEKLAAALESMDNYRDPFGGPSLSFSATKRTASDYLNLYQVVDQKWVTVVEALPY